MCGIFGYKGKEAAVPFLEHGLQRLEYRGYDSAGLVVLDKKGKHEIVKSVGKVNNLSQEIPDDLQDSQDFCFGIAHTRWATHGNPSIENTHPHTSEDKKFFVVHNGIIENRMKLRKELESEGYNFYSKTDTEVIPALLSKYRDGSLISTVEKVLPRLQGAYALCIISSHCPDELIAVKRGSPLIFGIDIEKKAFFISSDSQALTGYAKEITFLEDGDLVHINKENYVIKAEGSIIKKKFEELSDSEIKTSKGEYPTFMLKEIFEQAKILDRTFKGRINFGTGDIYSNSLEFIKDKNIKKIVFVGCGTAHNAGKIGTLWMEDLAGVEAKAEISSEYIYKNIKTDPSVLHVFVSQSGETADTIEVLKYVKDRGGMTMGIVNVAGSTVSRLTDCGFFLRAGAEIGVASTKAFTAQMSCILMLSLFLGKKENLRYTQFKQIIQELKEIPSKMEEVLGKENEIKKVAKDLAKYKNMFFLGRHYQYPIAEEGSLKMKEISYINTSSYPSGELKHGSLALIDEDFPSVLLCPRDFLWEQNMSSISEIQSRGGKVLAVSDSEVSGADWSLKLPSTIDVLMPFLSNVCLQLLAYHVSDELGRDIDKPRNLAKSVTVK